MKGGFVCIGKPGFKVTFKNRLRKLFGKFAKPFFAFPQCFFGLKIVRNVPADAEQDRLVVPYSPGNFRFNRYKPAFLGLQGHWANIPGACQQLGNVFGGCFMLFGRVKIKHMLFGYFLYGVMKIAPGSFVGENNPAIGIDNKEIVINSVEKSFQVSFGFRNFFLMTGLHDCGPDMRSNGFQCFFCRFRNMFQSVRCHIEAGNHISFVLDRQNGYGVEPFLSGMFDI